MPYLLLPADERELVRHLCDGLGLVLLLSDRAPDEEPAVAAAPLDALPDELPGPAGPFSGVAVPRALLFWAPEIGPVRTLATAPAPVEAADRVRRQLTAESAGASGDRLEDVIDATRTPVLRWRRCSFRTDQLLVPGLLQGMPLPRADQPPTLLRLHGRAKRWVEARGVRLDPFELSPDPPVPRPKNPGPFRVWALPHAAAWVEAGGRIWPWTG